MPEEEGGFLSRKPGGIPMMIWIAGAVLVVYLIYRHYAGGGGVAASGNTGDTGGTITTGTTNVQSGAVQISVTQGGSDQDQPQPPNHRKKTTVSTHTGPLPVSRVHRSKAVNREIHEINQINRGKKDNK